jgi:hypothetical protein
VQRCRNWTGIRIVIVRSELVRALYREHYRDIAVSSSFWSVGFLMLFQRAVGPGIGDDWRAVEVRSGKPQLKGFKKSSMNIFEYSSNTASGLIFGAILASWVTVIRGGERPVECR